MSIQTWLEKLYVGNLPYDTGEQDLESLFAAAGTVESVSVMRDMATGRARGFAFVEMASDEDAQNAISQFNNYSLGGRNLTVNEARPKPQSSGGYGGWWGRGQGRASARAALVAGEWARRQPSWWATRAGRSRNARFRSVADGISEGHDQAAGERQRLRLRRGAGWHGYFFHQSACTGVRFDELREGQSVSFEKGQGPKGPRAERVTLD